MAEARGDCNREKRRFFPDRGRARLQAVVCRRGQCQRIRLAAHRAFPVDHLLPSASQNQAGAPMPKTEAELFSFLDSLGIRTTTRRHPPLYTVADSQALRGEIAGGHTKNLFLKDKKDNFFLLTVDEEAVVDLRQVHTLIGAASRVSFGKPEMLMELLGVAPGAVTVFGLINDTRRRVRIVLDRALMENATINAHPLTNEATTSIAAADLVRFIEATGHDAAILKVSA
jgi:Ala-tRNA(Pro) deacylase